MIRYAFRMPEHQNWYKSAFRAERSEISTENRKLTRAEVLRGKPARRECTVKGGR